jgi:hypothetical protein
MDMHDIVHHNYIVAKRKASSIAILLRAIEKYARLFVAFLELSFTYHKFFPLLESFFTFTKLFFFFEFGTSHVGMHLLDPNIKFSRF